MTCKIDEPLAGLINRKRSGRGPGAGAVRVCHRRPTGSALPIWTWAACSGPPRATSEREGWRARPPTWGLLQVQEAHLTVSGVHPREGERRSGCSRPDAARARNLPERGPPDAGDWATSVATLRTPGVRAAAGGGNQKGCREEQEPCRVYPHVWDALSFTKMPLDRQVSSVEPQDTVKYKISYVTCHPGTHCPVKFTGHVCNSLDNHNVPGGNEVCAPNWSVDGGVEHPCVHGLGHLELLAFCFLLFWVFF